MISPTFADIENARTLLKGVVIETPTLYSPTLSRMLKGNVFVKMENFQETGSFKERGAYVKLKSLSSSCLKRGIIAMSAGNHAQAVAFHAHNLEAPATIVMPLLTPPLKVRETEKWGARVILAGDTVDDSRDVAETIAKQERLTFIHPYDDPWIIAGQGTIGIEMLEACPELDALLIPIGGGGLCAGIAVAAKFLKPSLKIYGVEVEGFASMSLALYGRKEKIQSGLTLAEAIAVKTPGLLPQQLLKPLLEDIIVIREEEIERSVELFLQKQKIVIEGGGAVGLAGFLHAPELFMHQSVGIVASGGNIDARLLSSIMLRGKIREGFLSSLRIEASDIPGSLAHITHIIAHYQGNIIDVKHQRLFYEIPIKKADIDIMIETYGREHLRSIVNALEAAGFKVIQLVEEAL